MIIYNVTVKVGLSVHTGWRQWIEESHIPRMMATGLFNNYRLCHLLEQDEQDGITYVIQYILDSPEQFERYEQEYAEPLRREMAARFDGDCVAFRTLMEGID